MEIAALHWETDGACSRTGCWEEH